MSNSFAILREMNRLGRQEQIDIKTNTGDNQSAVKDCTPKIKTNFIADNNIANISDSRIVGIYAGQVRVIKYKLIA